MKTNQTKKRNRDVRADEKKIKAALAVIKKHEKATLDGALRVGKHLLKEFFGGNIEAFRSKSGKDPSFRALCKRPELVMHGVSQSTLRNYIRVYATDADYPKNLRGKLGLATRIELLRVADSENRVAIAQVAVKKNLSTREVKKLIASQNPPPSPKKRQKAWRRAADRLFSDARDLDVPLEDLKRYLDVLTKMIASRETAPRVTLPSAPVPDILDASPLAGEVIPTPEAPELPSNESHEESNVPVAELAPTQAIDVEEGQPHIESPVENEWFIATVKEKDGQPGLSPATCLVNASDQSTAKAAVVEKRGVLLERVSVQAIRECGVGYGILSVEEYLGRPMSKRLRTLDEIGEANA